MSNVNTKTVNLLRSPKISLAFRLVLGAIIMISAIPKLIDIENNSVYLVYSYYILPLHPLNLARLAGLVVPFLELLCGISLILGIFTRLAALTWATLSLAYLGVKLDIIFIQGRIIPCGCFSSLLPEMLVTQSIWIDVVSILMCLQIFLSGRKRQILSMWEIIQKARNKRQNS
jgi:hypothetical protein